MAAAVFVRHHCRGVRYQRPPQRSRALSVALSVRLSQRGPIPLAVEFDCAAGEVLALVGPSGSGKTTVLRSIAGLYRPRRGRIVCDGEIWLDSDRGVRLSAQRRRVGLMFQNYALFPHLSAAANVVVALGHLPRGARRARADELLSMVNLDGLTERKPAQLSGGQQQRVALARALARDPAVLLLDEPFSAVDQVTRRKLRLELAALTRRLAVPIVLVTHDLDEALMLSSRLCVMRAGRSLQIGATETVIQRPRDAEVARLVDALNLFEGQVLGQENDRVRLLWAGRELIAISPQRFDPGSRVHWLIAPGSVLLHQRRRPSLGEHENPLAGRVTELLTLSGLSTVIVDIETDGAPVPAALSVQLPPHVVRRNALKIGDRIGVSLLADAIHLMPWRPPGRRDEAIMV